MVSNMMFAFVVTDNEALESDGVCEGGKHTAWVFNEWLP